MTHCGYFTQYLGNQSLYRCLKCRFDTFDQNKITRHVQYSCKPAALPETELSTVEWLHSQRNQYPGLEIGISLLTWNTKAASVQAAEALVAEMGRLQHLGIKVRLFWADNGSDDGTVEALNDVFQPNLAAKVLNTVNLGQSHARNSLILEARKTDIDYLLMVDGDIEIVPYSSLALARYLDTADPKIGCIGMYSPNCTHVFDLETAIQCRKLDPWMVDIDPRIAWTNYGMFRREVIEQVMFQEFGPFAGPGWGFEDDDYCLRMMDAGFDCVNTKYYRHLHRRRHSSLRLLDQAQQSVTFKARKQYMIDTWGRHSNEAIRSHIRRLRNQHADGL